MKILWCVWSKHASIIWVKHANFSVTVNTNPMASFNVCRNNIQCIVSLILATSLLSNQQQQLLEKDCLSKFIYGFLFKTQYILRGIFVPNVWQKEERERVLIINKFPNIA